MVVAVRDTRILALLVTGSLLAVPAGSVPVGAATSDDSDCWPADDGTDAYYCNVPEECLEDDACELPDECEQVDDSTIRCEPPDLEDSTTYENDTYEQNQTYENDTYDENRTSEQDYERHTAWNVSERGVIYPSENQSTSPSGTPVVDCRSDPENRTVVCEHREECRQEPGMPSCRPSPRCDRLEEHRYRCPPVRSSDPPAEGELPEEPPEPPEGEGPHCELGPERGTVICTPPPECEGKIGETEFCTPPPECEAQDDGTYLCTIPDRAHDAEASAESGDLCEPGPEEGTAVCTPPPECEGKIGETEFCTPPPQCEPYGDGKFLCEMSGGHHATGEASGDAGVADAEQSLGEEEIFGDGKAEARAEARAAIAKALREAAEEFHSELDSLRDEYEDRVDELRAEYQQGKAELRQDYEDCRAQIPDGIDAGEYNDRLRGCLDDARQGLEELKSRLLDRHDEIKQEFKERIEEARGEACEKAERAALNAIAEHGIFDANPGDLMPERALDLCPSFADFGGEA